MKTLNLFSLVAGMLSAFAFVNSGLAQISYSGVRRTRR